MVICEVNELNISAEVWQNEWKFQNNPSGMLIAW